MQTGKLSVKSFSFLQKFKSFESFKHTFAKLLRSVYRGVFCRATKCNFCRAEVAWSRCDITAIKTPLNRREGATWARYRGEVAWSRRDIVGVSNLFETWCNFGATKIALSCATKIACVNGPLHLSRDECQPYLYESKTHHFVARLLHQPLINEIH